MFVWAPYVDRAKSLLECRDCFVFRDKSIDVSVEDIRKRHAIVLVENLRDGYCRFFRDNNITYYPENVEYDSVNGCFIAKGARIGENVRILPGAYIGPEVTIGNNCYIGSGTRIVGEVYIGNNVVIRENSVIGADGLSTDRDESGKALTVIARGAIDSTTTKRGSKIDNCSFISHNVT